MFTTPIRTRILRKPASVAAAALMLAWFLAATPTAPAATPPWPDAPVPAALVDQDVSLFLTDFGQKLGIEVAISAAVQGHVAGRLPALAPGALLDRLGAQYGFNWYYDGHSLVISAESERVRRLMPLGHANFEALTAELDRLGISDPRYAVKHARGTDQVRIDGPPRFAELVEHTLASLDQDHHPKAVRIYQGDSDR
jgi:type III secretion protein C